MDYSTIKEVFAAQRHDLFTYGPARSRLSSLNRTQTDRFSEAGLDRLPWARHFILVPDELAQAPGPIDAASHPESVIDLDAPPGSRFGLLMAYALAQPWEIDSSMPAATCEAIMAHLAACVPEQFTHNYPHPEHPALAMLSVPSSESDEFAFGSDPLVQIAATGAMMRQMQGTLPPDVGQSLLEEICIKARASTRLMRTDLLSGLLERKAIDDDGFDDGEDDRISELLMHILSSALKPIIKGECPVDIEQPSKRLDNLSVLDYLSFYLERDDIGNVLITLLALIQAADTKDAPAKPRARHQMRL